MLPFQIKPISRSALTVSLENPVWPHVWKLYRGIEFVWEWDLGHDRLFIPSGYCCDGASIPFRFYDVVDPINALPAAFLHDLLYETCAGTRTYTIDGFEQDLTTSFVDKPEKERRARSDALLKSFWLYDNMPIDMAEKGYVAVRLFGHDPWVSVEPQPSKEKLIDKLINNSGVK